MSKQGSQSPLVNSTPSSAINSIFHQAHSLSAKDNQEVSSMFTPILSTNFDSEKDKTNKNPKYFSSGQLCDTITFIEEQERYSFSEINLDDTLSTTTKLKTLNYSTKRIKRLKDDEKELKRNPQKFHRKQKDSNPQEWVQCEKCEKWRRLPRHISAKDLPEVWFCTMNTWDPRSASCAVHEDYKTESYKSTIRGDNAILRNSTNRSSSIVPSSPTGTSGKLSYRSLIFGHNGRSNRYSRPISERMSVVESLFSIQRLEDDITLATTTIPNKVMYANSSVFQSKSTIASQNVTFKTDKETPNQESPLFTFLNQSRLWKDLYGGISLTNTTDDLLILYKNKSRTKDRLQNKYLGTNNHIQSMKDIVYSVIKGETLEAHDVLLRCQCEDFYDTNWSELQASSTYDTIRLALEGLIDDGLVEELQTKQDDLFCILTTKYRRIQNKNIYEPLVNFRNEKISQICCMKVLKPWKQTKLHPQK